MPAAMQNAPSPRREQTVKTVEIKQAPKHAQPQKSGAAPERSGFMKRLYDLPRAAGIAALALLLALSLVVGNARALSRATPANFLRQGSVSSIVEDRAAQATNAVSVISRVFADDPSPVSDALSQVSDALELFNAAKDAQSLSRADQTLTSAVSALSAAAGGALGAEDAQMFQRALDHFAEQGSFLRQEARAYNASAEKARALYERLPARFLLKKPALFEGV